MPLLDECKEAAGEAWERYWRHPWLEALASGSLSIPQFVSFQVDDAPFVPQLHRVLAFGLAKAPTGCRWARAVSTLLDEVFVTQEVEAKREIVGALGVQNCRFDRWAMSPRREAYANHLMRTALEGTTGQIAAALLPCTFFTEIVGRQLGSLSLSGPAPYRRWVSIYADKRMHGILDVHVEIAESEVARDPSGRSELIRLFVRSVQHQVAVFDDALGPRMTWPKVALTGLNPSVVSFEGDGGEEDGGSAAGVAMPSQI